MLNKNIHKCNICDNILEKIFNYNDEHSYYRCQYCNFVKRIPGDLYVDYSNEYMSEELLNKSLVLAKNYYKRLNKIIKNGSVCLEIGGSFGFFCKLLKEKNNCIVYNVESSILATEYANKNKINTVSKIEEIDSNISFDNIFSFHVLEHLPPDDINSLISNLISRLKKGGLLILFTPNAESFKLKLFRKGYPWLAFPEHVSFLSGKSIEILCLLPFYYLLELFSTNKDQLVIIGRKKPGY